MKKTFKGLGRAAAVIVIAIFMLSSFGILQDNAGVHNGSTITAYAWGKGSFKSGGFRSSGFKSSGFKSSGFKSNGYKSGIFKSSSGGSKKSGSYKSGSFSNSKNYGSSSKSSSSGSYSAPKAKRSYIPLPIIIPWGHHSYSHGYGGSYALGFIGSLFRLALIVILIIVVIRIIKRRR